MKKCIIKILLHISPTVITVVVLETNLRCILAGPKSLYVGEILTILIFRQVPLLSYVVLADISSLIPYRYSSFQLTATSFWSSLEWMARVIAVRIAFVRCTFSCKSVEKKLVGKNGPPGQLMPKVKPLNCPVRQPLCQNKSSY